MTDVSCVCGSHEFWFMWEHQGQDVIALVWEPKNPKQTVRSLMFINKGYYKRSDLEPWGKRSQGVVTTPSRNGKEKQDT